MVFCGDWVVVFLAPKKCHLFENIPVNFPVMGCGANPGGWWE
jgi:hypothetical protein